MPSRQRFIVASIAIAWFCASVASAQRPLGPRDPSTQSVSVRESAAAAQNFDLARRMERLKEWDKSADVYQHELIEKYSDRVVSIDDPTGGGGGQRYTSVTLRVQELLGKWPEEGLQRYRARYEGPAASMLESGSPDDPALLNKVTQQYFPTEAAKTAGMHLIEVYLENGEFAAAAWMGERFLTHHPGITADDRPKFLFRTALAEHLAGDDAAAKRNLDELKNQHVDAKGTFRGQQVVLASELEKMLASPAATARGASSDSWPILGGDASRGRVPQASAHPSARLPARIPLTRSRPRPVVAGADRAPAAAARPRDFMRDWEGYRRDYELTVMPVVDHGEIFYQFNGRIYARSLESGYTLPGWATTYGDDTRQPPRYDRPVIGGNAMVVPGTSLATVTATDDAVLAVIAPEPQAYDPNNPQPVFPGGGMVVPGNAAGTAAQLVCLDRTNGVKRWAISPAQFPESMKAFNKLRLGGSPLVVGDNVYVAARGGSGGAAGAPAQFGETSYVACFALADGKPKWVCYLASNDAGDAAAAGLPMMGGGGGSGVVSHLAYAGGRVYAVTNLGAIAAVDAYAGNIVWLNKYPRPAMNWNNGAMFFPMGFQPGNPAGGGGGNTNNPFASLRKPWAQNPVIVKDGRVFCLPTDSPNIMVYDAGSGAEIKRIPTSEVEDATTLLGVVGERIIVNSLTRVFALDWQRYDPTRVNTNWYWASLSMGAPQTGPQKSSGTNDNKDTIRGRGFVTADSVFIATRWNINRLNLRTGGLKLAESYPKSDDGWGPDEGPGNIIATSDEVIVAGFDSIGVYSDLAMARAKLDREVESAPNDPMPRLRYAGMLYAAGEIPAALEKLDQAIGLIGGVGAMRPGAARDMVFSIAMEFAERAAAPQVGASDPQRAISLYERAAAAADSPQQQVTWRLSRARFLRSQRPRDFQTEVALYQQILSDPAYRTALVPSSAGDDSSTGGAIPAGKVAEINIADCIKASPSSYAQFERAASDALAAAQKASDPAAMLAVAQVYPNAKCASTAMMGAADAFETAGKNRQATQVLAQAYRSYRDNPQTKVRILEAQARDYLRLPNGINVAIGRLAEGAKIDGARLTSTLKLPDGTTIENHAFDQAAQFLRTFSTTKSQASLPEFGIPATERHENVRVVADMKESNETRISDVDALVVPPDELYDRPTRYDRVVTWTKGKGVSVYAVGTTTPLGTAAVMTQENEKPRGGIWMGDNLLVWNADSVALLKGDALAPAAWTMALRTLPTVDVVEPDPSVVRKEEIAAGQMMRGEVFINGNQVIIGENQVININRGGRVVINANGVQVPVVIRRVNGPGGINEPAAEEITAVRPIGEDRVVLATNTGRVVALDLSSGKLAWQTRVGDVPFLQVLANDDFVAVRIGDDTGSHIVALDTFAGQTVFNLAVPPGSPNPPLNMALAADGTLVYSLPDRICGKDLFESGTKLKFGDEPMTTPENRPFEQAISADQLIVSQGRILAVGDQGQYFHVVSLDTGKETRPPLSTNGPPPPNQWRVWLRAAGPRVYVLTRRSIRNPDLTEDGRLPAGSSDPSMGLDPPGSPAISTAFIGKRHVVLLGYLIDAGALIPDGGAVRFRLYGYARYLAGGSQKESGLLDLDIPVSSDAKVDQWQAVEGGFYCHGANGVVHFLQPVRREIKTDQPRQSRDKNIRF